MRLPRLAAVAAAAAVFLAACSSTPDASGSGVAAGANADFPAGAPGPARAVTAPVGDGVLAADQRGCTGLGPQSAKPSLTGIAHTARGPELVTESGSCLLRLTAVDAPFEHGWSASGRELHVHFVDGWRRVDVELTETEVLAEEVATTAASFAAVPARPMAEIPGGALLELEEAGDELLVWARHEGRSGRLAVGRRAHGATVVGSPYDVTALAWAVVEERDAIVCSREARWKTEATRGGQRVKVDGTEAAGMWPLLWTPDGVLVLSEEPPDCDAEPDAVWTLRSGSASRMAAAAYSVAVRPGAG